MKRLFFTACVLSSLLPTLAIAAELIPVAVLPPVTDQKTSQGLTRAMQERASALILSTGQFSVTDARQVVSMAARHRVKLETLADHNVARQAAQRLGVKLFVYSKLTPTKGGWTLEITAASVGDPGTE